MLPPRDGPSLPDRARDPIDYAGLAETLDVLGYGARLELLDVLRFPHLVSEIRLSPQRHALGENPERAASKQAVQAHLDRLVDAGLVRVDQVRAEGRQANRYVVNSQQLYSLVEQLRGLCVRYAGRGAAGDMTGTLQSAAPPADARGPRLTLVHGVYEGKPFPLTDATSVEGRWVIGRQRAASVALDYDPFVSSEHAAVTRDAAGFVLHDLPRSKNGTLLNWQVVPKGSAAKLRAGDVIGVGRSFLVFAPE